MGSRGKTVLFWAFILICLCVLWGVVRISPPRSERTEISYPDLMDRVKSGQVYDATIEGSDLVGHLKPTPAALFHSTLPADYSDLQTALLAARVPFSIREPRQLTLLPLLQNLGPFAALALLAVPPFWVIFRKAGFSGWLAMLILIPMVNLIMIYIVAFSKWRPHSAPAL
jgi:cell division protease FtsH